MKASFEVIQAGRPESSFLCYRRIAAAYPFNWHYHPEYELTYVYRGQGTRIVGDDISLYRGDDLVLLGPDLPHTWYTAQGSPDDPEAHRAVVVQFAHGVVVGGLLDLPEGRLLGRLLRASGRGLRFGAGSVERVAGDLLALEDAQGLGRLARLLSILDVLARADDALPLASPEFAPSLGDRDETRMDRVFRYLHAHYRRPLRLAEVAEEAAMTGSSFSRFFRRMTGKTFTAYVNDLRVGHACERLIAGEETVAEVAFASGFNNLSHFNRCFRDRKGVTPSRFRKTFAG